jgi:hypothetical protein
MSAPGDTDDEASESEQGASPTHQQHQQLMMLSAAAIDSSVHATKTIQLQVSIQGHDFFVSG